MSLYIVWYQDFPTKMWRCEYMKGVTVAYCNTRLMSVRGRREEWFGVDTADENN